MAFVTFETYDGEPVELNPATVISVGTYAHFDADKELPEELMIVNPSGLPEVSNDPEKLEKANKLRTSERVVVNFIGGSAVVKGKLEDVKKALSDQPAAAKPQAAPEPAPSKPQAVQEPPRGRN